MLIELDTVLPFGMYKGHNVKDLLVGTKHTLKSRINYFQWIARKTQHTLSQQLIDKMTEIWRYYDMDNPGEGSHYNHAIRDDYPANWNSNYDDFGEGCDPYRIVEY